MLPIAQPMAMMNAPAPTFIEDTTLSAVLEEYTRQDGQLHFWFPERSLPFFAIGDLHFGQFGRPLSASTIAPTSPGTRLAKARSIAAKAMRSCGASERESSFIRSVVLLLSAMGEKGLGTTGSLRLDRQTKPKKAGRAKASPFG
jgi:hypothetical protein